MIIGIGTDIVYIPRILALWEKFGDKFINRIFSSKEIQDSYNYNIYEAKINHFAKRFAAKEAYIKAIGKGFSKQIAMKNIIIYNNNYGKPYIKSPCSCDHIIELSLSDDNDYAMAFVILHTK
ncbi:holo-[acyl-carrier-protein] synthase [Neoehrlichia mikurensis]|uniref:Holo-[acyl-carrier-protein] synthase n=1 Tax=Neoehrlichia mikurensis TaxID=89586 RepID=A0A9Q9F3L4_9RICK|nr:holo-[acyl-carrier-protein] synthase [Neoehrlichia mikurensis]QXK92041.1 holo-[acyl-carrier-protein] synthase [Neoehrlichia mikurensis]QXK92498.1 holo-[acyl-carrier-protein] synthase [Neoehrlichia mikurensis]QXK93734.1 holo-[acyl-carrier-protein] synthase [Neoehrlichia mikurensis]UTO55292.1 holo-[acyl-carrier-protein] synthase [Neoehrlichia mikurensis]UTO56213.1 holo-[acyl-carrier-protein] synthase [Neoehrlichia mikurensis]